MGYLKGLPSDLVMTFGSGTGLSGYTGVLTVLFLSALGVSKGKVIIVLIIEGIGFSSAGDVRDTVLREFRMGG